MSTDPSWLYSTIAQSSAAIVAIIGGFITASVLMLTTEKRSLRNQLDDKKLELATLIRQHGDPTRVTGVTSQGNKIEIPTKPTSLKAKEISMLQTEISNLESRLKVFAYPPHLGWGLITLAFLAVFGIFSPILILADVEFSLVARIYTVVAFGLGILGVFVYIIFLIRELRR